MCSADNADSFAGQLLCVGIVYAFLINKLVPYFRVKRYEMNQDLANVIVSKESGKNGSLLLGTSLALASMILIPAFAMRLGLGASLTGALRIAMMKASNQAIRG